MGSTGPQGPQGAPGSATLPTALANINTLFNSEFIGGPAGFSGGGGSDCTMGDLQLSNQSYNATMIVADGRLLAIQQNAALFSLLGTRFGGNGSTNFALPDLRAFAPPGLFWNICAFGIYPSRN